MEAATKVQAGDEARPRIGGHYTLRCPLCGAQHEDRAEDLLLSCPEDHPPSLLRAVYRQKRLVIHPELSGAFRYADWLPIRRTLSGVSGPVVYRSAGLASALGLSNLLIVFSGFWPERGALMETCTFKELEAQAVCGRIPAGWSSSLVVCSAGNTARAFLQACSRAGIAALLVVPEHCLPLLWSAGGRSPFVRLAVVGGEADYADAIQAGSLIAQTDGFSAEGGARNAARRDGMGTTVLAATEAAGAIPDHYFQAVGSGTGAIAAWEASLRLLEDGRFGERKMKLHLAQNIPFTPMADAWRAGSRRLPEIHEAKARRDSKAVRAPVLTNRAPPYSVAGGLYDALSDCGGLMYRISNKEAERAGQLFEDREGCDLDPAAEVAVAALIQAVEAGSIGARSVVALNITGGGRKRIEATARVERLEPDVRFDMEDLRARGVAAVLRELRQREVSS
jgi:cysteate synthase